MPGSIDPASAGSSRTGDASGCPASGGGGLLPAELRTWMRVLAAAGAVEQQLRKHVKEAMGVSHDEFLILCLLADQPGNTLRMTRIAELLGRPKTRLTYQVACLQHADLVVRESVCGDRRGVALTLTNKARRLLAQHSPALAAAVNQVLADSIGPTHCEALSDLLAQASSAPAATRDPDARTGDSKTVS
ncbi:MarR family winged helix-turn-helix transcriptional regulator [Streptomyces carpinensis]|uniref:MarR family winged helix-turn-helix transcriptional regulator n=1 Tax=Streptomyces carpinensis TaxID=66369 RepID=A0ABV1VXU7_9ACTN|nr:MarR family winged helix-turn-helix transcriptional regulator [Streptomyces carpinensis]